jgi:hypothetical protein
VADTLLTLCGLCQLRAWTEQPTVIHNLRKGIETDSFKDHPVALALVDCIAAHAPKQGEKEKHGWRYTPSADLKLPPECLQDFEIAMLGVCKPRGLELFTGNTLGPLTRTVKRWRGPLLMDPTLRRERVQTASAYLRAAGFSQHAAPPSAALSAAPSTASSAPSAASSAASSAAPSTAPSAAPSVAPSAAPSVTPSATPPPASPPSIPPSPAHSTDDWETEPQEPMVIDEQLELSDAQLEANRSDTSAIVRDLAAECRQAEMAPRQADVAPHFWASGEDPLFGPPCLPYLPASIATMPLFQRSTTVTGPRTAAPSTPSAVDTYISGLQARFGFHTADTKKLKWPHLAEAVHQAAIFDLSPAPMVLSTATRLEQPTSFVPLAQQRSRRDGTSSAASAATGQGASPASLTAKLQTLPAEEAPYTAVRMDAFKIVLSSEATRLYPHIRIMDETRLAQAVLRDHTAEKRLHGFSAMPRIVLLEFVPVDTTTEAVCAWLAPLEVQRRQGKLELHWCRASDEEESVDFTTVAALDDVAAYKMCHFQLVDHQQWLLALQLDGTLLGGRAVRVSAIEDRPIGKTKDDIDAAFVTADLIGRPKATYSYVEVAAVAYPGIAEVETAAICTNNRYLQVTDLARLHALTLSYANGTGILLVTTQVDGDARFRHLSFSMLAFLLLNAALATRAALEAHRNAFVAEIRGYGFPLPDVSIEDAAHFVIPASSLARWPGAGRLGLSPSAATPFYPTLPPIHFYLGLRLKGWRWFAPIIAGLPRTSGSDIYHGLRKLINIALLAMNKLLIIGTEVILFAHFTDVIERAPEARLLHDHLDAHMKQDHESALRKISQPVIDALETRVPGGRGTAWVCSIGRDWWRAWYDDRLRPLERMQLCLLTTRRISIWKESLLELDLYKESGLSIELDRDSFINCHDMVPARALTNSTIPGPSSDFLC